VSAATRPSSFDLPRHERCYRDEEERAPRLPKETHQKEATNHKRLIGGKKLFGRVGVPMVQELVSMTIF